MTETTRERGERLFQEICGAPAAAMQSEFLDLTIEHIFGEVWARSDLSSRDQRLLTLAVLVCTGETSSMAVHMRMALESGDLTRAELEGVVIHLAHYAGWPRGSSAFQTLAQGLAERTEPSS